MGGAFCWWMSDNLPLLPIRTSMWRTKRHRPMYSSWHSAAQSNSATRYLLRSSLRRASKSRGWRLGIPNNKSARRKKNRNRKPPVRKYSFKHQLEREIEMRWVGLPRNRRMPLWMLLNDCLMLNTSPVNRWAATTWIMAAAQACL